MKRFSLCVALVLLVAFLTTTVAAAAPTDTLRNLAGAYNRELNAHAQFTAWAVQADKEGYGEVASLFRALARAEQIHADSLQALLKKANAKPVVKILKPVVASTQNNVRAAVFAENELRDVIYPRAVKQAEIDKDKTALDLLTRLKNVEATHARLLAFTSAHLSSLSGSRARAYYVCSDCGYVSDKPNFAKCGICPAPRGKFITVS